MANETRRRPTDTWSFPVARVVGIEVRVHVAFVVLLVLFALSGAVVWLVVAFTCVLIHELAHSVVARKRGAEVGSMALDDPEGWDVYRRIQEASSDDADVRLFTNLTGVGNIEVNAFQRLADVVVQKSIREGFGLVVSETLWKGTPVVAGRAGGIPLQLHDGTGGFLVDTVEECAERVLHLLRNPDEGSSSPSGAEGSSGTTSSSPASSPTNCASTGT